MCVCLSVSVSVEGRYAIEESVEGGGITLLGGGKGTRALCQVSGVSQDITMELVE